MAHLSARTLHETRVRPALQRLGWGQAEFVIAPEPRYVDEIGAAYEYSLPDTRPLLVAVTPSRGNRDDALARWAGSIGYNLGAPLAVVASEDRALLLAPHMIRRGEEASLPLLSPTLETLADADSVLRRLPAHAQGPVPLVLGEVAPVWGSAGMQPAAQAAAGPRVSARGRRGRRLSTVPEVASDAELAVEAGFASLDVRPTAVARAAAVGGHFPRDGYRSRAPVDEALMLHLADARRQILRDGSGDRLGTQPALGADHRLLELIGTLLFIRIVEDGREHEVLTRGALLACADHPDPLPGVRALAERLAPVYGRAAVPLHRAAAFSHDPVRQLIRGLYYDHARRATLDFALMDEDLLAQLYQQYLQYLLIDREKVDQVRLFGRDDRIAVSIRKQFGIYYTPRSVVELVLREVERYLPPGPTPPRVLDPACGAGAFLRPALLWMAGRWSDASAAERAASVVGVDVDPRASTLARQAIARAFVTLDGRCPQLAIHTRDFLAPDTPDFMAAQGTFDVVIGNPPFRSHQSARALEPDVVAALRRAFPEVVRGETNLVAFFLAQALRLLRPGGVLAMVVPRRVLRGGDDARLRSFLQGEAELLSVTDFGPAQVFDNPSITTAIVVLRKRRSAPHAAVARRRPRAAPVRDATAVFSMRYRDDLAPIFTRALRGAARTSEVADVLLRATCRPEAGNPWLLLTDVGREAMRRLTAGGVPLDEVVEGTYATDLMSGRGKTLLFDELPGGSAAVARVRSHALGREIEVERALLRRAARREHVQRFRLAESERPTLVFYPYGADGAPIAEQRLLGLRADFPRAGAFIREVSPALLGVRGHRTGKTWYAPGGTRVNAPWHAAATRDGFGDRLLVFPRFARIPHVAPVAAAGVVPVGALVVFAVRVAYAGAFDALLAFFNSSIANWFGLMVAPVFGVGGFADRSPVTFRTLRLPTRLLTADAGSVRAAMQTLAGANLASSPAQLLRAEREVDDWVCDHLEFGASLREVVRAEAAGFDRNALYQSVRDRADALSSIAPATPRVRRLVRA